MRDTTALSGFNNIRQYMSYEIPCFPAYRAKLLSARSKSSGVISLKFLAAYSVAIVNGAALLFIVVKLLLAGLRRLTE